MSIVLLALVALLAMVPLVSAVPDIYPQTFAKTDDNDHFLFGGRGDYNQGGDLYTWVVKVQLEDSSYNVL